MPEASKPLADRVTEIQPSPDEMVRLAAKDAISARNAYGPITAWSLMRRCASACGSSQMVALPNGAAPTIAGMIPLNFSDNRKASDANPSGNVETITLDISLFVAATFFQNVVGATVPSAMQGGVEGGHDLVDRQIVETIDAPRIEDSLGVHASVLNLSIAGMTAREIAATMGWGDTKQGERKAVAAQDAALAALTGVEVRLAA